MTSVEICPAQPNAFSLLAEAALDRSPVGGWTHNFYRYPARFSPRFAAAAIECFSRPSDLVLDPYMGGGTAIVEGMIAGRHMVGNDLNSLAAFITRVKTTALMKGEIAAVRQWAAKKIRTFNYLQPIDDLRFFVDPIKTTNLTLVRARFIKKLVAAALASITELPTQPCRDFTKCIVLRVAQWALDGRIRHTPLADFREKLRLMTDEMLRSIQGFGERALRSGGGVTIINSDASRLCESAVFQNGSQKASLVVTSPPYPGVHVLYHRWQVDGRRETPAPYWIAGCNDGQGGAFYNFGDRREAAADTYFRNSLNTLKAIRRVMKTGSHIVQMLAFNRPEDQLPRYLHNMQEAGFSELPICGRHRIWREVPNRKWHASLGGKTHSSREVVLVHRTI